MTRSSKARYRLCRVTVVTLVAMLCIVSLAGAAPGSLDLTFGGDGVVTTAIGRANDYASAVAVQADGKIIMAGSASDGGGDQFALARFNTDGSLDTSFDHDGRVTTDVGTSAAKVAAVAVQADGKIVAAGSAFIGSTQIVLARYNADGSLDTAFGAGGKVTPVPGLSGYAYAVAVQADGKIVAAGQSTAGGNWDFVLVRLNADGSLDTAFDGDGMVTTDMGSTNEQINAIAVQADGKIVAAGQSWGSWYDFALARYNVDGSLDTAYDGDGKLLTAIGGSHDRAFAVAVQADGKIVAAGQSSNGSNYDFALVRYNAAGALDTSFDGDGKVTTAFGSGDDSASAMTVLADGRLVVAGYAFNGSNTDFALARYNANGALDASFGSGGKLTTAIGSSDDSATAMAVQTDGKILAAGNTWNGGSTLRDVALVRYGAEGTLDGTFDGDGVLTATFLGGDDSGYAVVLQPDNKIIMAGSTFFNNTNRFALARYDADGGLDPSYGASGVVTTAVGSSAAFAYAAALQPDGKLVAAGYAWVNSVRGVFALTRYNTDGALDTSFGANGVVTTAFGANAAYAYAVAVQVDGKIVAAGSVHNGSTYDVALARYNADGALDPSFGSAGKVTTAISTADDGAYALAMQADGRIVVAGYASVTGSSYFALARYNTDGSLDAAFDSDGMVITDFGSSTHQANGVAVQADGKIVAAGRMYNASLRDYDFAVARYNTNGTLDTSFDGDGRVTTGWGVGHEYAYAVAVQADGKILVAGSDDDDFVVGRYTAGGILDASFGSAGRAVADIRGRDDSGRALALQRDGKIVAAGSAHNGGNYDFALARYEVAATSSAALPSGNSATLQNVTITNHSDTACTVTATKYPVPPGGTPGDNGELPIHWTLSTDCATYRFDLVFSYTDAELANGKNVVEGNLRAYRSTNGNDFDLVSSTVNTSANTVTALGVTQLSWWALGSSAPLAVDLDFFTATATGDGVVLAWETVSELDLLGFSLYRAEATNAAPVKLNDALIPAQAPGSSIGHAYAWVDAKVEPGGTYWYMLEDVALDGTVTRHAPVAIEVALGGPNAVGLATFGAAATGPSLAELASFVVLALAAAASMVRAGLRKRR